MSTRVAGYLDGVAYAAEIDPDAVPDDDTGSLVAAPVAIRALVASSEGSIIDVTPVGPFVKVDLDDTLSILAVLHSRTEVVAVTGDIPEGWNDRNRGEVTR